MAQSEAGHAPNRCYVDQDGDLHLNGANFRMDESGSILSTTELGFLDGVTAGTVTASKAVVADANSGISGLGTVTMADAKNIVANTTTGTKIGVNTSEKWGFWNATPVIQPAGGNQAALTDNTGGVAGATLAAITAGANYAQSDMNTVKNSISSLAQNINVIRGVLVTLGLMKGSA